MSEFYPRALYETINRIKNERIQVALLRVAERHRLQLLNDESLGWYRRNAHGWTYKDTEKKVSITMDNQERSWFLLRASPEQRTEWMNLYNSISETDLYIFDKVSTEEQFIPILKNFLKGNLYSLQGYIRYNKVNISSRSKLFKAFQKATNNFTQRWTDDNYFSRRIECTRKISGLMVVYGDFEQEKPFINYLSAAYQSELQTMPTGKD